MQTQIEDEQRQREEAREAYNLAERRATVLTGEIEELRTALEQVSADNSSHKNKPWSYIRDSCLFLG